MYLGEIRRIFFFFSPHHAACGMLVPQPGMEAMLLAVEVLSPNHLTTREVQNQRDLNSGTDESTHTLIMNTI